MDEDNLKSVLDDLGLVEERKKFVGQVLTGEKDPGTVFSSFQSFFILRKND